MWTFRGCGDLGAKHHLKSLFEALAQHLYQAGDTSVVLGRLLVVVRQVRYVNQIQCEHVIYSEVAPCLIEVCIWNGQQILSTLAGTLLFELVIIVLQVFERLDNHLVRFIQNSIKFILLTRSISVPRQRRVVGTIRKSAHNKRYIF